MQEIKYCTFGKKPKRRNKKRSRLFRVVIGGVIDRLRSGASESAEIRENSGNESDDPRRD